MNLVIWGGRGHARVVLEAFGSDVTRVLCVGDIDTNVKSPLEGVPIVHSFDDLEAELQLSLIHI